MVVNYYKTCIIDTVMGTDNSPSEFLTAKTQIKLNEEELIVIWVINSFHAGLYFSGRDIYMKMYNVYCWWGGNTTQTIGLNW